MKYRVCPTALGSILLFGSLSGLWGCGASEFSITDTDASASQDAPWGADGQAGHSPEAGHSGGQGGSSGAAGQGGASEDCLDQKDNDGDGAIDCADSDCTPDYECVDSAPQGWQGFFRVRQSPWYPGIPESQCADQSPAQRYYLPTSRPIQCGCICGALQKAECSPAPILCSASLESCNDGSVFDWTVQLGTGQCINHLDGATALSCRLAGPSTVTSPGACDAQPTELERPAMWSQVTDACPEPAVSGAGCPNGQVCLARGKGTNSGAVCVRQAVEQAVCPSGWGQAFRGYESGVDSRRCDSCACSGDLSTMRCTGTVYTVYDLDDCQPGEQIPIAINSETCTSATFLIDLATWSLRLDSRPTVTEGACKAGPVQTSGRIETHAPVLFCCRP